MFKSAIDQFVLVSKATSTSFKTIRVVSFFVLLLCLSQLLPTGLFYGSTTESPRSSKFHRYSNSTIDNSSKPRSDSSVHFVKLQTTDLPPAANGPVAKPVGEAPDARLAQSRSSSSKKSGSRKNASKKLRDQSVADIINQLRKSNDETTSVWDNQLAEAIKNLRESDLPDPDAAKIHAQQMAYELERLLRPEYDNNGLAWLDFLHWDELNEQLQSEKPSRSKLRQLALNMRQNYPGLEIEQFVHLRDAIERYIEALQYGSNADRSLGIFEDRIANLAEVLRESPEGSDLDQSRTISLLVKYLRQGQQAPGLVYSLRDRYRYANARVLVSSEFAQRQLGRPVMENQPVRESILGTAIRGTSNVNGFVTPRFVPNDHAATVQLCLAARFSSDNIGTNRGVKIYSLGSSPITAAETIQLTDSGLISLNDTTVGSQLNTNVTGIGHKCRLVRRIAKKQIAKQKGQADAIAEGRLQNRLKQQFHDQIGEQLTEANTNLTPPKLPILKRLGLPKPTRKTWTSGSYLALLWKEATDEQLMAPASCPLPVEPTGASIQLHHSLITNLIDPVLAGRTIKNTDLDKFAKQFGGDIPVGIQAESEEDPWSVTLAQHHPIEVDFEDNRIVFKLRTTRLERSGQALGLNSIITAKYETVLYNGTFQLVRDGNVDIDFARGSGGLRATTYRSFLKDKFDKLFKEQLLPEPVSIAEALPPEAPSIQLSSITADQGWLQVHVQ